jgi:hypothetical protein
MGDNDDVSMVGPTSGPCATHRCMHLCTEMTHVVGSHWMAKQFRAQMGLTIGSRSNMPQACAWEVARQAHATRLALVGH